MINGLANLITGRCTLSRHVVCVIVCVRACVRVCAYHWYIQLLMCNNFTVSYNPMLHVQVSINIQLPVNTYFEE